MKRFNTTGTCFPQEHYMVDITERLEVIKGMILQNDYFCINRGRQYGKTTTLAALEKYLVPDYCVFSLSFEGISEDTFGTPERICANFMHQLALFVDCNVIFGLSDENAKIISDCSEKYADSMPIEKFKMAIYKICQKNSLPLVLLIDEVDQASNYDSFLIFLGILRNMYLTRKKIPTFQSIILAGVYDIKNLKLKMRPEDEHQYNSPWNIAVPFTEDMSLHSDGIADMLNEYKTEHSIQFDNQHVAQLIYDYTSGYPFLVSRLCQIIDENNFSWDKEGVLKAVNCIMKEDNTLFDDLTKKINQFPKMKTLLKNILYLGDKKSYSPDEQYIQLARRFNFLAEQNGFIKISCRLLETRLYNLFLAEEDTERMFSSGIADKNQFVHDGLIDMQHLLERFCVHFNDIFRTDDGTMDHEFVEKQGRKQFLLYIRPIINGIGNYYIEAETRDNTRTDVILDYLRQQYVIELKIWHGNSYNERGEKQLVDYLDFYHQKKGYMVSFCFNKNKQSGVHSVPIGDCEIVEAIV